MKYGAENEAGVLYAKKGYYKGKEVTITHHSGSQVWLEDYPVKDVDGMMVCGCWVESASVVFGGDEVVSDQDNKKKPTKKQNKRNTRTNKSKTIANKAKNN